MTSSYAPLSGTGVKEKEYNEDRPHLALKGKTPAERVHELAQLSRSAMDLARLIHA